MIIIIVRIISYLYTSFFETLFTVADVVPIPAIIFQPIIDNNIRKIAVIDIYISQNNSLGLCNTDLNIQLQGNVCV